MRKFSIAVGFAILSPTWVVAETSPFPADEVQVIEQEFVVSHEARSKIIVLKEMTVAGLQESVGHEDWKERLAGATANSGPAVKEAFDDFVAKNVTASSLRGIEFASQKIALILKTEEPWGTTRERGWASFFQRYDDAQEYYSLSRVGFSKDRQIAIYSSNTYSMGMIDGYREEDGRFFILNKKGESWHVVWTIDAHADPKTHPGLTRASAIVIDAKNRAEGLAAASLWMQKNLPEVPVQQVNAALNPPESLQTIGQERAWIQIFVHFPGHHRPVWFDVSSCYWK